MAFDFLDPHPKEIDNPICFQAENIDVRLALPIGIRQGYFLMYVIGIIYIISATARFMYYRKKYQRLAKRGVVLVWLNTVASILQGTGSFLADAIYFECWIKVIFLVMIVPIVAAQAPLRLLDFYNKYVLAVAIQHALGGGGAAAAAGIGESNSNPERQETSISLSSTNPKLDTSSSELANSKIDIKGTLSLLWNFRKLISLSDGNQSGSELDFKVTLEMVRYLKTFSSTKFQAFITISVLLPYLIFVIVQTFTVPYLNPFIGCIACSTNGASQIVIVIGGILGTFIAVFFAMLLRRLNDPHQILRENLLVGLSALYTLIGFGLHIFVPDNGYSNFWSMGYIAWSGFLLMLFFTTDYQVFMAKRAELDGMAQSPDGTKANRASVLDSQMVVSSFAQQQQDRISVPKDAKQCLNNPQFLPLFEKHMNTEFSAEILRMYLDCIQFEKTYYDMTEQSRKARAKKIVMMHVEDHAVMQVNLPFTIKTELLQQIETDRIAVGMFVKAETELLQMMRGCFNRFTKTKQFIQLRDEITNNNQNPQGPIPGLFARLFHSRTSSSATKKVANSLAPRDVGV